MIRIQKFFGSVNDFIDPLIDELAPLSKDTTTKEQYETLGGRTVGWLNASYGRDNIINFINLADIEGFDNVIVDILSNNIKTTGRFNKYLRNKLGDKYEETD